MTDLVRELQLALKHAGYNPGPVDGQLGPNTLSAALQAIEASTDGEGLPDLDDDVVEPVAPKKSASRGSTKGRKLAIVVGHNSRGKGAVRKDTKESEFDYNNKLAKMIGAAASLYDIDVEIFNRKSKGGYTAEIRDVYRRVDGWGADAAIELHFNAATPAATGTETLSSGSAGSLKLASEVQSEMVHTLGLSDRGVKTRKSGRGSYSLRAGRAPTILIEPFFNANPKDLARTKTDKQRRALASAILKGADTVFDETA